MPYATRVAEFVERSNKVLPPDFYLRPVDEQRAMHRGLLTEFPHQIPAGVAITDETVRHGGRRYPVRVYRPAGRRGRAVVLYIRGGGFVLGSLDTHHSVSADLAAATGCLVIAPDFRMAPEHPFPAAVEDCYGALLGIAAGARRLEIDPARIVITGDSSGANMAVAACMMSRDRAGPAIRAQALISPVLDFTRWEHGGADVPLLSGGEMMFFTACYSPDPARLRHPYLSPLVSGQFHGLPPAYVMAAELDSLVTDAQEYVSRLRDSGIAAELVVEAGLVHSPMRARYLSPAVGSAWARFCDRTAALAQAGEAGGAAE